MYILLSEAKSRSSYCSNIDQWKFADRWVTAWICNFPTLSNCKKKVSGIIGSVSCSLRTDPKKPQEFSVYSGIHSLTHFWPIFWFYTNWKHQKTSVVFWSFQGVKWEDWPEIRSAGLYWPVISFTRCLSYWKVISSCSGSCLTF